MLSVQNVINAVCTVIQILWSDNFISDVVRNHVSDLNKWMPIVDRTVDHIIIVDGFQKMEGPFKTALDEHL